MTCCSIIIGGLTDGSPLQNIGARAPRIDVHPATPYVATEHRHVRQDSLPVNVSCRRDSLLVTDSGSHSGIPFEAPFMDFCVTKFRQNSGDISKKMTCSKFWPHVIWGPLYSRGPYARAYCA